MRALAHLQHAQSAPQARLDLDVAHEEHVVEDEREAAEIVAAAERGHLVREDRRPAGGAHEAAERPHVARQPVVSRAANSSSARLSTTTRLTSPRGELRAHERPDLVEVDLDRRDVPDRSAGRPDTPSSRSPAAAAFSRTCTSFSWNERCRQRSPCSQARVDERQREQRLADARRPDRERRVAARDAAADRGVERRQPEAGAPFLRGDVLGQRRLEAGEHLEARRCRAGSCAGRTSPRRRASSARAAGGGRSGRSPRSRAG